MRFSDIVSSYDALQSSEMLEETRLSSEFTIGFELEGICDNDTDPELYSRGTIAGYNSGQTSSGGAKKLKEILDKLLGIKGSSVRDNTFEPIAYLGEYDDDRAITAISWIPSVKAKEGYYWISFDRGYLYYSEEEDESRSDMEEIGNLSEGGAVLEIFDSCKKEYNLNFDELTIDKSKIERDGSVDPNPNTDSSHAWSFEYASPLIPFNPTNMNKMLRFLKKLSDYGIKTNETCGFHVHISFDKMTREDAKWLLFCIANDDQLLDEVTMLRSDGNEPVKFFTDHYATKNWFNKLQVHGSLNNWEFQQNTDDKYLVIRMHPQGTLEWRGPRNFINNGQNEQMIQDFMKKLWKIILKFAKIVDMKEYNGFKKAEVMEKMNISGRFATTEYKINKAKAADVKNYLISRPITYVSIKPERLLSCFEEYSYDLLDRNKYTDEALKTYSNIWNKIPEQNKKIIIDHDIERNNIPSFTTQLFKMNGTNKFDSITTKFIIQYILKYSHSTTVVDYINNNFNVLTLTDKVIIKQLYEQLPIRCFSRLMNKLDTSLFDLDFLRQIANSNNKSLLLNLDHLPLKIQRILIRKNPYNVQFINNPDKTIIDELRKNVGDNIDEYILGVL